ncbi:MAG: hypothetical protein FJ398_09840 [Verrucomicrobia bacterium]|nr:hypothetical protein [Verrucomicrobiota bacterium]
MKANWSVLLAVAVSLGGCGKRDAAPTAAKATNPPAASGNPLTAPVDYLGAVGKAQKLATKTVDLTSLNQAIRQFHAGEDRFPKDLNELVTEGYLPRLPAPPSGTRLEYSPARGQVRVVRQDH